LSNRFTRLRISPEYQGLVAYAKDAMTGLDLAGKIRDDTERERLIAALAEETEALRTDDAIKQAARGEKQGVVEKRRSTVRSVEQPPTPPDLLSHVIKDYDLAEVFSYINPTMLYVRHLGFRGRFEEALEGGDPRAVELHERVRQVQDLMLPRDDITANAVYQFFRVASENDNDLLVLSPDGKQVLERLQFGRQAEGDGLCLADYVLPRMSSVPDYLGMFVTSIGPGVRALADEWREKGDYLASHILQVLALEGAEGFAELLHQRMRAMWGRTDPADITKQDLFRAAYAGKRYSFGYPACPRLEDQGVLWRLLTPETHIGVGLTEEFMMEPEGSVSALTLHHPEAKYFNLSPEDIDRLEKKLTAN
jgi:5-methyltetrahydrofolate--homocysteine methyltransferase